LQEWAEDSPQTTGTTSRICQTTEYKQRKRKGTCEEVVKRYEKMILGNLGTTLRLENEGSGPKHPSRDIQSFPPSTFLRNGNHCLYHSSPSTH